MPNKNDTIKYLGIDWGEKRIGLALGDSETGMATPFGVVAGVDDIIMTVRKEEVDVIVVGLPVKMSGKVETTDNFNKFLKEIKDNVKIPVLTVDERLTSKAADALPGSKKTKAPRDAVAAMLILQTYLDKL